MHRRLPSLVALICTLLLSASIYAAERKPVAVVVIASNISIRDVSADGLPNLRALMDAGGAGLMSARTGRPTKDVDPPSSPLVKGGKRASPLGKGGGRGVGMEPGCVSLGAGALGIGGAEARIAADANGDLGGVSAAQLFTYRTGKMPGSAEILHLEAIRLNKANAGSSYNAQPGALGTALRSAGIRTAVIGNSDFGDEIHREAVAVAMDSDGLVDYGCVSNPDLIEPAAGSPYGIRANTDRLLGEFDRVAGTARFIVIDSGDTLRADRYAALCSDEAAIRVKREAVRSLDSLVGSLRRRLDLRIDFLMLVSPAPPSVTELEGERLTPVIAAGGEFGRGLLTSGSTKRAGVVTISDVAPTLIAFFGIQTPVRMVGRPMQVSRSGDWPALLLLNTSASRQTSQMAVMRGSSVVLSGIVIIVTLAAFVGASGWWRRAAAHAVLLVATLPLGMLYLPLLRPEGVLGAVAWLLALQFGLIAVCAAAFRSPPRAFVWLCGGLAASIIVDVARGSVLMSSSIAGYSLAEGARYYGIGNELMGTLLGAAIIGVGMALSGSSLGGRAREALAVGVFGVTFAAIGAPALGWNTGGAMAALPATAVTLMRRRDWRITVRTLLIVLLLMAIVVGAMLLFDALKSGETQSHMGRAAGLTGGSPLALLSLVQRKLSLNLMLVSTSLWSRLLLVSLAGAAALYWSSRRARDKAATLSSEESAAAAGCLVGSAAAFAFNDSGVVAAACCSAFLWALLALRRLS